jgi:homoserine kinase
VIGRELPTATVVRVPATSANLGPGFDAFGVALGLRMEARVRDATDGVRVRSTGEGQSELPSGDDNLLWRAFIALHAHVGVPVPAVTIEVTSPIPLERGLGSSSAAIVAGLGLARATSGVAIADRDVVRLATEMEGHPDNVAPAVLGGLVVAAARDDGTLVLRRGQPHRRLRPLLLVPDERQSTRSARGVLPRSLPTGDVVTQVGRAGHLVGALLGAWPADPAVAGDRLHEPARAEAMPESGELLDELRRAGVHAWLSGAGPAVAAAVPRRDGDAHDRVAAFAARHGWVVLPLDWDLAGLDTATGPPAG